MIATPHWPPRSAPRLFVPGPLAEDQAITLTASQAHYLSRVMRVSPEDIVVLCDDETGEWAALVSQVGKHEVALAVKSRLREREQVPDFTLCVALLKKPRFDQIVEKATELGVHRIQPVLTRRSIADKLNLERVRSIATEAAEQCARTALPEIAEPVKLDALLAGWDDACALFFADELGGEPVAGAFAERGAPAALLIGPEGGFEDGERASIRALEASVPISLGPRILRAETAAIAAAALWMAIAGDWHAQ